MRQSEFESKDSSVKCGEVIFVLSTWHNLKNALIKALLTRILDCVVVGTQLEHEISLVIGGHVYLDYNILARSVLTSDDTIGEPSPRSLVLARPGISRIATDATPASIATILMLEATTESLMIVEVRRVVIAQPPH